jgi:TetR/AcrR family transcriptional repressor of nem operon
MARNVEFDEQLAVSRAMDVFWRKGYNGTTMRDLTEEALHRVKDEGSS